jgi:hypothetical protein
LDLAAQPAPVTLQEEQTACWKSTPAIVGYIAALIFLVHVALANRYGFHVDELYFLACSEHLSWGFIDQPPLIAVIGRIARTLFGESLLGIRLLPSLSAGLLVWFAARIAREFGGGRFAQIATALAVAVTPAYLIVHSSLLIVAFDPLVWSACIYFMVRAVGMDSTRDWLLAGVVAGLGLELKYTIGLLLLALLVGLLATPARRALASWKPWAAFAITLLIAAPNFLWQATHHFPFFVWQHYIRTHPGVQSFNTSLDFLVDQIVLVLPALLFVGGAAWFFSGSKEGRDFRYLGVALLAVLLVCSRMGKPHYALPLYATVFAAGATVLEGLTSREGMRGRRAAIIAWTVALGALMAPCFLPILPPEKFVAYQSALPLPLPVRSEDYEFQQQMPQQFAWEFGWSEMVAATAEMYNSLSSEEKKKAGIVTASYGQAGAIDLLGKKYGLPKAVCGQLSYHDFGSRNYTGEVLITIGGSPEKIASKCRSVQPGPYLPNPYSYSVMQGPIVNVCRGLKYNLTETWAAQKHY